MYSTSRKWKENIYKNVQCAMNIYIDDILINPDYITSFKKGGDIFDGEFELGSTPSQYIEMKIYKEQISMPKKIRVEYGILINNALTVAEVNAMLIGTLNSIPVKSLSSNNSSFEMIPIGIYNVDDYTDNDDGTITIKALDNMIKFEFNYDGSDLINKKGYATLLEVAKDICNKAGVELGSTSFLYSDKLVAVYDNEVTAREYISYIAESAGCFATIGRDGKLYFREIYQDKTEIPLELFGEYKWGEEFQISKVSYEDGTRNFKFGDDTKNNLWINQDNVYIVDEEQIQKIYNKINGLTINSFEGKTVIDPAIDIGDKIIIDGKSIVYQGEMELQGRFIAQIDSKIQISAKEETSVKTTSQKVVNRRVQSRIDQVEGAITQLIEETSENSEKLSQHEQTIDDITDTVSSVETKLDKDYYTKTEANSQIEQKANSITSTVSQNISTAKQEAINSANTSTDSKLSKYTTTEKLGTFIEQNYEYVKLAWNQISEFIQMMIINNNASFAILDENKQVMMALDKTGQHFYKNDGKTVFGEMGVNTINNQNYISFGVDGEYGEEISNGMAWGITTKSDNKFWPILYIKNFTMSAKNQGGSHGKLMLDDCDLVLSGTGSSIEIDGILISGDPSGDKLYFYDAFGNLLLFIQGQNGVIEPTINILDNISFYKNNAGSNSFKIGTGDSCCLFTDDGYISGRTLYLGGICFYNDGSITGNVNFNTIPTYSGKKLVYGSFGHEYHLMWTGSRLDFWVDTTNVGTLSDKRLKTEIEDIDEDFIKAIKEVEMKQFKVVNRNGLISFGILAQDLIEIFKKYNKNPFDYEIIYETKYRTDDDTIYYAINYEQFLILKQKATDIKIKEQQEKIEKQDKIITDLIKQIESLKKGANK